MFRGLLLAPVFARNFVMANTASPPAELPPAAISAMDVMHAGHIGLHLCLRLRVAPVLPELFLDRPYLDSPKACRRPFRRHLNGFVQVPGFDQEESAQLLLRLGEGAVGYRQLAASNPHGRGGPGALQGVRDDQVTTVPQGLDVGQGLAPEGVPLAP